MHLSIEEQVVLNKIKTPNKPFIYRINSSFSKGRVSPKKNNLPISDGNLPTIRLNKEAETKTSGIYVKNKSGKDKFIKRIENLTKPENIIKKINTKEKSGKRLKHKNGLNNSKPRINSEYHKLKLSGWLKWIPKLWVDVPMTVEMIKHNPRCSNNDNKWTYRIMGKEDYQRREQIKKLDPCTSNKVVYDHIEKSPFYTDISHPYLDDKKILDLKNNTGFMQSRSKQRGFRRAIINTGIPK